MCAPQKRPVLIYDAECGFCRRWVVRIRARTGHRVRFVPLQAFAVPLRFGVARADARRAVQLIEPSGERFEEADAIFHACPSQRVACGGLARRSAWAAKRVELCLPMDCAIQVWSAASGTWSRTQSPGDRSIGSSGWVYLRSLGIVYLAAFASLHVQVLVLYGQVGQTPFLFANGSHGGEGRISQSSPDAPTLLWLDPSDAGLVNLCRVGEAASLGLISTWRRELSRWLRGRPTFHLSRRAKSSCRTSGTLFCWRAACTR